MDHIKKCHPGLTEEVQRYRKSGQITKNGTQKTIPEMVKKFTTEEVSFNIRLILFCGSYLCELYLILIFVFFSSKSHV